MGQKINPKGLRVGVIHDWDAKWFADDKDFADVLHEDLKIRNHIDTALVDASVSRVEIERAANRINISINTAKPGMVIGKGGSEVDKLRNELNKLTGKRVHVNIIEIKARIGCKTCCRRYCTTIRKPYCIPSCSKQAIKTQCVEQKVSVLYLDV